MIRVYNQTLYICINKIIKTGSGKNEENMKRVDTAVKLICRYISHFGVYFTATVLFFSATGGAFSPSYYGTAALFGALMSLCDMIFLVKFIHSVVALSAIHVVIATVSFVVAFVLTSGAVEGSTGFVASVVFFLADALALALRGGYIALRNSAEKKEK